MLEYKYIPEPSTINLSF